MQEKERSEQRTGLQGRLVAKRRNELRAKLYQEIEKEQQGSEKVIPVSKKVSPSDLPEQKKGAPKKAVTQKRKPGRPPKRTSGRSKGR